jgi:hypothetical protein
LKQDFKNLIYCLKIIFKGLQIFWFSLSSKIRKIEEGLFHKTIRAKIKIDFISNIFLDFTKTCKVIDA